MNRQIVLTLIMSFIFGATFVVWLAWQEKNIPLSFQTEMIDNASSHAGILVTGTVHDANNLPLFAEADGIVTQVYVKSGDRVRRGRLLATLDYKPEDMERYNQLNEINKLLSDKDMSRTIGAFSSLSESTVINSRDRLNLYSDYLRSIRDIINFQQTLEDLRKKTVGKKIYAPFTGLVGEVYWQKGMMVQERRQDVPALVLGRESKDYYVSLEIGDDIVHRVKSGMKARISHPLNNEMELHGVVDSVASSPTTQDRQRFYSAVVKFPVELNIDTESKLRAQMRVTAEIYSDKSEAVDDVGFWVSRSAIDIVVPEHAVDQEVNLIAQNRAPSSLSVNPVDAPFEMHEGALLKSASNSLHPKEGTESTLYFLGPENKVVKARVLVSKRTQSRAFVKAQHPGPLRVITHVNAVPKRN